MNTAEKYEVLLSTISHEIRNPVTLINSYLQLISAAHPEVGKFEYWDTVGEEMHAKPALKFLGDSFYHSFAYPLSLHPLPSPFPDFGGM